MVRKKIIAGNWKMNKTPSEAVALVEELKPLVANEEVDVVFCVPAIDIVPVVEAAKGTNIQVGVVWRRQPVPNSVVFLNCLRRTDMWVSLWALCLRRLYSPPVPQRLWLSAL